MYLKCVVNLSNLIFSSCFIRKLFYFFWRSETCSSDSSSKPESEVDPFYEGQFLSAVLDLVETLLDRDYDVNLEVTALCAKLAYLPHPYTHEFLLNPTIPLTPRSRNLFTALQTAIERGLIATQSMGQVQVNIILEWNRLSHISDFMC